MQRNNSFGNPYVNRQNRNYYEIDSDQEYEREQGGPPHFNVDYQNE